MTTANRWINALLHHLAMIALVIGASAGMWAAAGPTDSPVEWRRHGSPCVPATWLESGAGAGHASAIRSSRSNGSNGQWSSERDQPRWHALGIAAMRWSPGEEADHRLSIASRDEAQRDGHAPRQPRAPPMV